VAFVRRLSVPSGGVELAVWVSGDRPEHDRTAATVVAVHGYPDTHSLWEPLVRQLPPHLRVVAYDVRGAGESGAPADRKGYAVARLVEDLVAVLDATLGSTARVHLLGHDWGSVQLWEAVLAEGSDPRLSGRLASFTSISGPSLGQFAAFLRSIRRPGRVAPVAMQLLRSSYLGLFLLPGLPQLAMGAVAGRTGANGVDLYRANVSVRPRPAVTKVPVQLVVPIRDLFLSPAVYAEAGHWTEQLERVDLDAGHWAPRTHPVQLAALVSSFVDRHG
jgi:pimeloyl-ACP methyl ester carboxylesterase